MLKILHPEVCTAFYPALGALAVVVPELRDSLPDTYESMKLRERLERHLSNAHFHAVLRDHDKYVPPATYDLLAAAQLIRDHITGSPELHGGALARLPVSAILKLVYGPDRRPDLWE